jgi:hypothetical protein
MGVKKIAPIPKQYPREFRSLESSLAENGYYRNPGAFKIILPSKGLNGHYLTGLDDEGLDLLKIENPEDREAERLRRKETRERLQRVTGLDLSSTSQFYNYAANLPESQKVTPIKLGNKIVPFNMEDPYQEIAWNWARVHPNIAPSLDSLRTGLVNPALVQYYVMDEEVESKMTFSKKQKLNKAISLNEGLTPTRRAKIARQMGLPATSSTLQETVYNMIDTLLKDGEFKSGRFRGSNPVTLFTELVAMDEARLDVKDTVSQAISSSIYRVRASGKIYEGENEIAGSEEELVNYLLQDKNQDDLLALQKKLKITKIHEEL